MKTLQTLLILGIGLFFVALLTFGAIKVAKEVERTIALGINNMYSTGE